MQKALIRPAAGHLLPADWVKGFYAALLCPVAPRFLRPNKTRDVTKVHGRNARKFRRTVIMPSHYRYLSLLLLLLVAGFSHSRVSAAPSDQSVLVESILSEDVDRQLVLIRQLV